jgi:hypothetical protein
LTLSLNLGQIVPWVDAAEKPATVNTPKHTDVTPLTRPHGGFARSWGIDAGLGNDNAHSMKSSPGEYRHRVSDAVLRPQEVHHLCGSITEADGIWDSDI